MREQEFNKDIIKRWEDVLDSKDFLPIEDMGRRFAVAQIMENTNNVRGWELRHNKKGAPASLTEAHFAADQMPSLLAETPTNVMGASSSTAGTGPIDIYDPVLIGMIRRVMPNLMAYDIMGVQPMTGPTGTIFSLRGWYGGQNGDTELFYNEANTGWSASAQGNSSHTGSNTEFIAQVGSSPDQLYTNDQTFTTSHGFDTTFSELLGKDTGNEFKEVGMTIDKINVVAKGRALKATYSIELAQDMMAIHGINAEAQLTTFVTNELLAEINREMVRTVYITATIGAQNTQSAGIFNMDVDADGRWLGEKMMGLYLQLQFEANEIAKATRFGRGNLLIMSSNVASALNAAKLMTYNEKMAENMKVDDTGNTFIGVLSNGMKAYIDPYHATSSNKHFVCVGYKGTTSAWDAGLFYCPYVPMQYMKAVDPKSFQPALGFKTRYGLVANPFATSSADGAISVTKKNRYYRLLAVTNLL